MMITVKETSMVKPAEETPRKALWLSNSDLMTLRAHIPIIYIYKNAARAASFFDAAVLKDALAKALVHFYPVAGRYACNKCSGRLEIDCNADTALVDLGDFSPTMELRTMLVPTVDVCADISSIPLLLAQVTYFKCGSVSLGVAMDHRLADGTSGFNFLNSWSELARGLDLTLPPIIDRKILAARDPPQPIFDHIEYQPAPTMKTRQEKTNPLSSSTNEVSLTPSIFKIKREQIDSLKENSRESGNAIDYSTFEILAGHIWKCVTMARSLPDDQETRLFISTSGRSRLQPPIPPNPFGNVIFMAAPVAMAGDLKSKPSWFAAGSIHDAIARMDNDYLRSAIDFLEVHQNMLLPHHGRMVYSPNLGIISHLRLPSYGADFGWGQPFYVAPLGMSIEEESYILHNTDNDGSLSVVISFNSEHMKVF